MLAGCDSQQLFVVQKGFQCAVSGGGKGEEEAQCPLSRCTRVGAAVRSNHTIPPRPNSFARLLPVTSALSLVHLQSSTRSTLSTALDRTMHALPSVIARRDLCRHWCRSRFHAREQVYFSYTIACATPALPFLFAVFRPTDHSRAAHYIYSTNHVRLQSNSHCHFTTTRQSGPTKL